MNSRAGTRISNLSTNPVVLVTAINALGGIVAFGKDVLQATYLGTSLQADALTLAYFFPDMVGNLVAGMAIGTVCVPLFSKALIEGGLESLIASVGWAGKRIMLAAAALYATLLVCANPLTHLLTGGSEPLRIAVFPLLLIMLPLIFFYPIVMIASAALQSLRHFYLPVAVQILVPMSSTIFMLVAMGEGLSQQSGAITSAWGILAGVMLMTGIIWFPLHRFLEKKKIRMSGSGLPVPHTLGPSLWKGLVHFGLILFASQSVYLAERFLASRTEVGAVAAMNYAFRLSQMPVWVYVSAFVSILLPQLSRQIASAQMDALGDMLHKAFVTILQVTLPTSVMLWLFRSEITKLLFYRGSFDMRSVDLTAGVLEGYALVIVFQSVGAIAVRYFLATESLNRLAMAAVVTAAVTFLADIPLTGWFGVKGLGYGAAAGAFLNALYIVGLLHREVRLNRLLKPVIMILAANLPPALLLSWASISNPAGVFDINNQLAIAVLLGCAAAVYGILYVLIAKMLGLFKLNSQMNEL